VSESRIAAYYDWLSFYESLVRRLGHRGGFDRLTVHRLLAPDRPGVSSADVVHDRLAAALGEMDAPRVVDAGCGMGGTTFYLHSRFGGQYDGLTLSRAQQSRAIREAARRGISSACRFHFRNYDAPLDDLVPGGADLIVAIESLAHSPNPAKTVAGLARALRPAGRLAIVDDVPDEELHEDDPDLVAFQHGWSCPAIARKSELLAAFRAGGLAVEVDDDLTSLVPLRDGRTLERLVRANRRWHRLIRATRARTLVDALHGGLMLERLYQRGAMRYRFLVARAPAASSSTLSAETIQSSYTLAP
jgi:SAM-dependent methyltransferase